MDGERPPCQAGRGSKRTVGQTQHDGFCLQHPKLLSASGALPLYPPAPVGRSRATCDPSAHIPYPRSNHMRRVARPSSSAPGDTGGAGAPRAGSFKLETTRVYAAMTARLAALLAVGCSLSSASNLAAQVTLRVDATEMALVRQIRDRIVKKQSKVASRKPNPWGLHDMHGNVMAWTLDQYVPDACERLETKTSAGAWVKSTRPYPHVVRGGSWRDTADKLRSARPRPLASRVGS